MKAGRIEVYQHSDKTTQNKGVAVIKVVCDSDYAARTTLFRAFCAYAALHAYATSAKTWDDIIGEYPKLESQRLHAQEKLGEKIAVHEITVVTL